ncbi:transmembrane repetitive protein [Oleiagrimonas citrea]|uniref:Uncharacterized protein n=1 Tax=Oleiagrimonas citrea TaxID=1665687 RepID=A0A846ZN25_9GAMM|nr:hypothetical protein [Oleiagrimonas citrea]NKZ39614.1 hypothetical protein [Oleiagrimonas citrea]
MKWLGYVHTPIAEHHRWSPHSRRSISTGKGTFSRTTRLMLHQMRWRKPPPQHGLNITAWVLSILVHLVVATAMLLVRPPHYAPPTPQGQENAIQVRFIDSSPPPPPPPPPVPPRKPTPVKEQVAQRAVATPAQAPNLAPIPVSAPARPKIDVRIARIEPKVEEKPQPLPQVQPVAQPPVSPPKPDAPAIAVPPPPKVVLEPSKMALPPPKVTLDQQTTVPSPSVMDQPIAIERPKPVQGAPKLDVQAEQATPAAVQPVQASPPALPQPQPQIDVGKVSPRQQIAVQPTQKLQIDAAAVEPTAAQSPIAVAAPAEAPSQDLPAAPVQAPTVRIDVAGTTAPQVDLSSSRTEVESVPDMHVQPPSVTPTPSSSVAPARSSTVVAPPRPDDTSWAQQSDRFGKKPVSQPGHGEAAQRQAGKGSPDGVPAYIQRQPQGNSDVMTRRYHGLDYKPTIFDKYWAPDNQDALTAWLQNLVDALSFKKTFDLGRGVRIHCGGWLLGFGCGGDPPSGPSAKSDDPRLNMAPAKPLVPGMGASTAAPAAPVSLPQSSSQSVECETARVSGGVLPPGCAAPKGARSHNW